MFMFIVVNCVPGYGYRALSNFTFAKYGISASFLLQWISKFFILKKIKHILLLRNKPILSVLIYKLIQDNTKMNMTKQIKYLLICIIILFIVFLRIAIFNKENVCTRK